MAFAKGTHFQIELYRKFDLAIQSLSRAGKWHSRVSESKSKIALFLNPNIAYRLSFLYMVFLYIRLKNIYAESSQILPYKISENTSFYWTVFCRILAYFKDTVIQIEKVSINDCLRVSKVSWKFRIRTITISQSFTREICCFLKKCPTF